MGSQNCTVFLVEERLCCQRERARRLRLKLHAIAGDDLERKLVNVFRAYNEISTVWDDLPGSRDQLQSSG